jgi:small subunit ribosomal protein S9
VADRDKVKPWLGTGRRKTAVARVRLFRGAGAMTINGRDADEYFVDERARAVIRQPLKVTKLLNKFDVIARVDGGGPTGQAGAVVLGIARALTKADNTAEARLREAGLLTRDGRMKERKKYGKRGARASFQFSKR